MYIRFADTGKQENITKDEELVNLTGASNWEEINDSDFNPLTQEYFKTSSGDYEIVSRQNYVLPYFRIYDFMNNSYDKLLYPGDIPFDIFGLISKSYISLGLRIKTLYFNPNDLTDSIVKVEYEFHKLPGETCMDERKQKIHFKMSDGTWHEHVKIITKKYTTSIQRQNELRSRRENIVEQLKSLASDMGILDRVEELFNLYSTETYQYTNSGSFNLRDSIRDDIVTLWLNENLPNGYPAREIIMTYFTVGTSEDI